MIKWVIKGIIAVLLYFIVGYTFVLIVSIISSPFNDAISSRVEKNLGGIAPEKLPQAFKLLIKNSLKNITNEIKKVCFILFLASIALVITGSNK